MTNEPSVIDRKTINDMTTDQLDTEIALRRERRLLAFIVWQEGVESKKRADAGRLKTQLEKHLDILTKDFGRIDAIEKKIDDRLNKVASIRLELEDYP